MRSAMIRLITISWRPPTIISAVSAARRQPGSSSWMFSSMSGEHPHRLVAPGHGARPGGEDLDDAHPRDVGLAGGELHVGVDACTEPVPQGGLFEVGPPDLPGLLSHDRIVGGQEGVFLVLEVLVERLSGHAGPRDDRFHAHLRVTQFGYGRADGGHDALALVGGDEAGQQSVSPAGKLMRMTTSPARCSGSPIAGSAG